MRVPDIKYGNVEGMVRQPNETLMAKCRLGPVQYRFI
jgi:hypothetical protein